MSENEKASDCPPLALPQPLHCPASDKVNNTGKQSDKQDILAAALAFAEKGWRVFPGKPDKKPHIRKNLIKATTDKEQIRKWWRRWPDARIGVPTDAASGVFVLDVDCKNGAQGFQSLAKLEAEHGKLPVTLTATTPSGGKHYYFKYIPGVRVSVNKLGPGLDIRAERGYAVVPPSPGYAYDNEEAPIAAAPPWLDKWLTENEKSRKAQGTPERHPSKSLSPRPYGWDLFPGNSENMVNELVREMQAAPEGSRNDTLNKMAFRFGQLVAGGEIEDLPEIQQKLKMAALASGLDDREVEATFQSGYQAGLMNPATPSIEAAVAALATLPLPLYERVRKQEAKRLGFRASKLDAMVAAVRGQDAEKLPFEETEPWHEPVIPATLLSEIANTIQRFVICSPAAAVAVALWVAMTYVMDAVNVAPLLVITAPEKRCGKTLLLSLIGKLAARAIVASNISSPALYRSIEKWTPTLLLDECDTFMKEDEGLRGIINSGHTRESAFVIRTVGDEHEPTRFSTWGAKALSGIGRLPGTIEDRAVIIELRRKLPGEKVERLRQAPPDLFATLRRKLARWAEDFSEAVKATRPPLPPSLNDRQQDNWEPLLAIAMTAGNEWLERATAAALELSGQAEASPTIGAELLGDIKAVFEAAGADKMPTSALINALCVDDERPWASFNPRGGILHSGITPRQLARYLREYGILSNTVRMSDGSVSKGYHRKAFEDAFSRYCP